MNVRFHQQKQLIISSSYLNPIINTIIHLLIYSSDGSKPSSVIAINLYNRLVAELSKIENSILVVHKLIRANLINNNKVQLLENKIMKFTEADDPFYYRLKQFCISNGFFKSYDKYLNNLSNSFYKMSNKIVRRDVSETKGRKSISSGKSAGRPKLDRSNCICLICKVTETSQWRFIDVYNDRWFDLVCNPCYMKYRSSTPLKNRKNLPIKVYSNIKNKPERPSLYEFKIEGPSKYPHIMFNDKNCENVNY